MPFPLFLLLSFPKDAGAVLDKMKATLSKPLAVDVTVTRKDCIGKGAVHLVIDRPHRMLFKVKWATDDFEAGWTEDRIVDFSRSQKLFLESGPYDGVYRPTSAYSPLPDYSFPMIVLVTDPRLLFRNPKVTLVGPETLKGGVATTHLKATGWDAWIADDGRLIQWRYDQQKPDGFVSVLMEFSNYKIGGPFPKSLFELAVPPGSVQDGLRKDLYPIQPGGAFPEQGWVAAGGAGQSFAPDKPFLVVAVAGDCEISARAAKALDTLKGDVPIYLVSDDGSVPSELRPFPVLKDARGSALDRLGAPGTPLFILVDKKHVVKRLWYGFETASEDRFVKEVKAELAK